MILGSSKETVLGELARLHPCQFCQYVDYCETEGHGTCDLLKAYEAVEGFIKEA